MMTIDPYRILYIVIIYINIKIPLIQFLDILGLFPRVTVM